MSPLFGPDAGRVLLKGTRIPGTIIGIETNVTHDDESTRFCEYAVEAGGKVYGIRQDLAPDDEIRLGMPVTLAVDGDAAVIEWGDSGTLSLEDAEDSRPRPASSTTSTAAVTAVR